MVTRENAPSTVRKPHVLSPSRANNRKSLCRKFVLGKRNGEIQHEQPGHHGKRSPLPHHRVAVSPDRSLSAGFTAARCWRKPGSGSIAPSPNWKPIMTLSVTRLPAIPRPTPQATRRELSGVRNWPRQRYAMVIRSNSRRGIICHSAYKADRGVSKLQGSGARLGDLHVGEAARTAAALEQGDAEQPDVDDGSWPGRRCASCSPRRRHARR